MRTKQFTRDVIDTLGKRVFEVQLPIPRDRELRDWIASEARAAVEERVALRTIIHDSALATEGDAAAVEEENELEAAPA